jgi:NTE family protein
MARPKIGLALGGGVARGWAHIGVLRALLELGIEPDIVCGTSVGALAGGAYLSGHLDSLEEWARGLTKRRMLGYLDMRFGGSGILGGKRLEKLMNEYFGDLNIQDLDRQFVAVTGELATGHEIWVRQGPLVQAIRASYALPGVFSPVKINDRWLIDGALVNPVPVSVCRALGARLVIAVTLSADAFGKSATDEQAFEDYQFDGEEDFSRSIIRAAARPDKIIMRQLFGAGKEAPGIGTVMLGALNIVMDRLARSRLAGDPPDVLISPRVGHVGLLDFDRADEMIDLGRAAVDRELDLIHEAMTILS